LECQKYLSRYVAIQIKATTERQSTRADMHEYKVLASFPWYAHHNIEKEADRYTT